MQNLVEIYDTLTQYKQKKVAVFLESMGLDYAFDADATAIVENDEGEILATGTLSGNVLKYIAVSDALKGEGISASMVSALITKAHQMGRKHLFLYTKPQNKEMFAPLGFYEIAKTESMLMMENKKNGIDSFLQNIEAPKSGKVGAIVANCNPFTKGHLYLIEKASELCDVLHLFILSEDRSYFSAKDRLELAKKCTSHIENVYVHESESYLVSHATFPTYFIKEKSRAKEAQADLDIALFTDKIAPALNIKYRFVGTEPYCEVTAGYNARMKKLLPQKGIELIEIERKDGISASCVRKAVIEKDFETVEKLVPCAVYEHIKNNN